MVEKETIIREQFKYTGLGNFKNCYKYAYDWLLGEQYTVIEEKYSEKVSGNEKEIEVQWKADRKLTDYFRIALGIRWHILAMTDVEVEMNGKKKKMNKFGELKIDIKGVLEKDYTGRWEKTGMSKFWKETYHKYIIPKNIEEKEIEVMRDTRNFKEEIKAFLDLTARRDYTP